MADKTTHLGRAGEFFAMSELLLRGWNVAVPVVDVGDDVFVIDDTDKTTYRLQVKTAEAVGGSNRSEGVSARFKLSRRQVSTPQVIELFYMLLVRVDERWLFLVLPREALAAHRQRFEAAERKGPGRRPATAESAKDALGLDVVISDGSATAWGESFAPYLGRWPSALSVVEQGPGTRSSPPPP